jgi:hypothetical protein
MLRATGRRLRDFWIYFKTGHSTYLVYSLSIMNFITLQHRLLISTIPFLEKYLSRLSTFVIVFFLTYIPIAMALGYFEYKKGEMKRRPMLNPYTQDTIEAQILQSRGLLSYMNGDVEEAKIQLTQSQEILNKWKNPQ